MTELAALRPPIEFEHFRWHWLIGQTGEPFVAQWEQSSVASGWRNFAGWSGSKAMAGCGIRYYGPCVKPISESDLETKARDLAATIFDALDTEDCIPAILTALRDAARGAGG